MILPARTLYWQRAMGEATMTDYWLSKLFYDLQAPPLAAEYRADRKAVMARYPIKSEVRQAVLKDDMAVIAPLVNPYLLRYYFHIIGMTDEVFLRQVHEAGTEQNG
jgi:hypothetical protein